MLVEPDALAQVLDSKVGEGLDAVFADASPDDAVLDPSLATSRSQSHRRVGEIAKGCSHGREARERLYHITFSFSSLPRMKQISRCSEIRLQRFSYTLWHVGIAKVGTPMALALLTTVLLLGVAIDLALRVRLIVRGRC